MIIFAFQRGVFDLDFWIWRWWVGCIRTVVHVEMIVPVLCKAERCQWCPKKDPERVDPPNRIKGMHLITYTITKADPLGFIVDKHHLNHGNKWEYRILDQIKEKSVLKLMKDLQRVEPKTFRSPEYNMYLRYTGRRSQCTGAKLNTPISEAAEQKTWFCSEIFSYVLSQCDGKELCRGFDPCTISPNDLYVNMQLGQGDATDAINRSKLERWCKSKDPDAMLREHGNEEHHWLLS